MAIEKMISAPNGAPVEYHRINLLNVEYPIFGDADPKVYVRVNSWKNYQAYQNKEAIMWQWTLDSVIDVAQFSEPEENLIDNPKSPFDGGLIVDYENPTIESASLRKLVEISKLYNQKNDGPLLTPFGLVDGDDNSKIKVAQTVTLWQVLERLGQAPDTIDFTMEDDSVQAITAEQLDVIGALMGAREQELRGIRNSLRVAVAEAETVEEVEAIHWPVPVMAPSSPMPTV